MSSGEIESSSVENEQELDSLPHRAPQQSFVIPKLVIQPPEEGGVVSAVFVLEEEDEVDEKEKENFESENKAEIVDPFKRYFTKLHILFMLVSVFVTAFVILEPKIYALFWKLYAPEETTDFVVNLKTCKIPNLYDGQSPLPFMWDLEVSRSGNLARVDFTCETVEQFSQVDNDQKLYLISKVKKRKCCFRNITRPDLMDSDSYKVTSSCKELPANGTDIAGTEFLMVQCIHQRNKTVDFNTHALLPSKPSVVEKVSYWNTHNSKDGNFPFSVVVIVIASTSRAQAHRSLPETMKYLESPEIGFTTMNGYQSMEENSGSQAFASSNILPLLTGLTLDEDELKLTTRWDNFTMLWNQFAEEKFVTMFLDDSRKMLRTVSGVNSKENARHMAFRKQPTDYYIKPFLEAHSEGIDALFPNKRTAKRHCIGRRPITTFLLQHLQRFHKKFENIPTFSFTYLSWPQQQYGLEALAKMDQTYLNFFEDFFDMSNILERTAVVVMSDHGDLHHPYFKTEHGSLEKLNPLLMIRLPQNLVNKHPKYLANLKVNSHRIVSPLDVHRTISVFSKLFTKRSSSSNHTTTSSFASFRDPTLNTFGTTQEQPVGRNIFTSEIPYNRYCAEAKIPEALCLCNKTKPGDYNGRSVMTENGMPEKYWKYIALPQE